MESDVKAGRFRERIVVRPQQLLFSMVMGAIFLPGVIMPAVDLIRRPASWAGPLLCMVLFGGAIAVLVLRELEPRFIDVFEHGLIFRRRGRKEFVRFSDIWLARERTYLSALRLTPWVTRQCLRMVGRRPLWLQQYRDNAAAVARLLELVPQRDVTIPVASVELLVKRMRWSALSHLASALGFAACAVGAAGVTWWRHHHGEEAGAVLAGLFVCGFTWAAIFFSRDARQLLPTRRSRLYRALVLDQAGIAWAYVEGAAGPLMGAVDSRARDHTVMFFFDDRESASVHSSAAEAEQLLALVAARIPGVMLGYGQEQIDAWARQR